MMTFAIRLYPAARYDADMETTVLGEPSETIATIEAEYPALAQAAAEPTILATRTETSACWQRGKRVTMTVYTMAEDCLCAWTTARGLMALVRA